MASDFCRGRNALQKLAAHIVGQATLHEDTLNAGEWVDGMSSDRTGSSSWAPTTPSPGFCH